MTAFKAIFCFNFFSRNLIAFILSDFNSSFIFPGILLNSIIVFNSSCMDKLYSLTNFWCSGDFICAFGSCSEGRIMLHILHQRIEIWFFSKIFAKFSFFIVIVFAISFELFVEFILEELPKFDCCIISWNIFSFSFFSSSNFSPEFCELYWLFKLILFIFSFEVLLLSPIELFKFKLLFILFIIFKSSGTTINWLWIYFPFDSVFTKYLVILFSLFFSWL